MKKLSLVVSFLILLISSACFGSPGTQAGAARSESSPPQQQPATPEETVPDAGMQAEYVEIKRLVRDREQAMQDGNKCAQLVTRTECVDDDYTPPADEPIIAFDCGFADGIDGTLSGDTPQSMWSLELLATAKLATSLEDVATEYRYPPESWEPKLRRYEAREIAYAAKLKEIESGDPELREQRLAALDGNEDYDPALDPLHPHYIVDTDMRTYRQDRQPGLREIQSIDGCGAGETPILVRGEPKAQRIRLIPGFFSELCKRTSRALDGDDCPYWFEATQEQPMDLAGYYRYEARWPNGSKTVGTADVDKLHAGDDEGYAELIIRDPESN